MTVPEQAVSPAGTAATTAPPPSTIRWIPAPVPESAAAVRAAGYPAWLAALLARRGVADAESARRFLEPSLEHLHDPLLLFGMPQAVERVMRARDRGEKVAVVGDYDVDGVTATALLLVVLRRCGIDAEAIVPHRLREGYGFQETHVERAVELGCTLVVTVDCGTSAGPAVEAAAARGIDVVVTDHHLPGEGLPAGTVLVNPRQPECEYPFADLSGVGLAFKLASALLARCGRAVDVRALLRIACLGTIADLVPLRGENRVIATLGLADLRETRSRGLRALLRVAGVRGRTRAADVGFKLGPRLNAAGRLDTAEHALRLLLTADEAEADRLAGELDAWNRERQAAELRAVEEAREMLVPRTPRPAILVAWSPAWHRGVVGIAAGRIARELHRPTILLACDGEVAVGSGRSIPDVALHELVGRFAGELERFGGHAQAIGLTARVDRLEALRAALEEAAAASWPEDRLVQRLEYELELPVAALPRALLELERLEPFGQGNPAPLARLGPLQVLGAPRRFGNGHLSALARNAGDSEKGSPAVRLLGWGWANRADRFVGRFEALGHLERDDESGGPVLRLVDVRAAS